MEGKSYLHIINVCLFVCFLQFPDVTASDCGDIPEVALATISYSNGTERHPDGTVATFECHYLYQVAPTSDGTRTCVNGSWTGRSPWCKPVRALCSYNEYLVGRYGRVCPTERCRPNRGRNGICSANKMCHCDGVCGWKCIATDEDYYCPEVSTPNGVNVTYNPPERRFGGEAFFECAAGWQYHSGGIGQRCLSSRTWGGSMMVCIPRQVCEDLPTVEHATPRDTDKLYFSPGDSHTYTCNSGYTIRGSRDITCLSDLKWTEPQFTCNPLYCGPPGDVPNAYLENQIFTFGARATYICRAGYEHPPNTPSYRICQADREWSHTIPSCIPVVCPTINSINHGTVTAYDYEYLSQISFACDEGYRLEGTRRRECQANATWSGEEAVCTEIVCVDPGIPAHGSRQYQGTTVHYSNYQPSAARSFRYNEVVYYSCDSSYEFDGSVSNRCTDTGQWAYPLPKCGGSCTVPNNPQNGYFGSSTGTAVTHGNAVDVRCYWGYSRRVSSIRCDDGNWSHTDTYSSPLCVADPCDAPTPALNLNITYEPIVSQYDLYNNRIPHRTTVKYSCNYGYHLPGGDIQVTCNDGNYNPRVTVPDCQPVPCSMDQVSFGKVKYSSGSSGRFQALKFNPKHGVYRKVFCEDGYDVHSFSSSQCENGQWVNVGSETMRCVPKPCSAFPQTNLQITRVVGSSPTLGTYSDGTVATVRCLQGYRLAVGNGTYTCQGSTWLPVIPACIQTSNILIGAHTYQADHEGASMNPSIFAVDGIVDGNYERHSCTRMKKMLNPWWKAEMRDTYEIKSIKIFNRLDDKQYHIERAEVRVGRYRDIFRNPVCSEPITHQQINDSINLNYGILLTCGNGMLGNVVSVNIPTEGNKRKQLSLCEVDVHGEGPISTNGITDESEETRAACVVPTVPNAVLVRQSIQDGIVVGRAMGQLVYAGVKIQYRCAEDYALNGTWPSVYYSPLLECTNSSTWSVDVPVCEPEKCGVENIQNGYLRSSSPANHGDAISFSCDQNYQKSHSGDITCRFGQLHPVIPACEPASCSLMDLPSYMKSPLHIYPHNTQLQVTCDVGYQRNGRRPLPLCWYGVWNEHLQATCQRVECPAPGSINFANMSLVNRAQDATQRYYHGDTVRYVCKGNNVLVGNEERDCRNGSWTGSLPECNLPVTQGLQSCMLPERTNNEHYSIAGVRGTTDIWTEGAPHGSRGVTISVRCDPGYSPQPAATLECDDGVWSTDVPRCVRQERSCRRPDSISLVEQFVNGEETVEATNYPHEQLSEGTTIVSRCVDPLRYEFHGAVTRTCREGQWTGETPRCDQSLTIFRVYKGIYQMRSNGTIVLYPHEAYIDCYVPQFRVANIVVSPGIQYKGIYFLSGYGAARKRLRIRSPREPDNGRLTCNVNHERSIAHSINIQVAEIQCDTPGMIANGQRYDYDQRHTGWPRNGEYPMNKEIFYVCDDGFQLHGAYKITCVMGQWSDITPRCERTTCGELSRPENGFKIGDGTEIGYTVLFSCFAGFELRGASSAECLESGTWSNALPTCEAISQPTSICDTMSCEVWEKCVISDSQQATCSCISPHNCPSTNSGEGAVCGNDGSYYPSLCRLKALSCLLYDNRLDVAASSDVCTSGVIRTLPPSTSRSEEEPDSDASSSSSYNSISIDTRRVNSRGDNPRGDMPQTEAPVTEPPTYTFCEAAESCPTIPVAQACHNVSSAVVAYPVGWNSSTGVLEIEIYIDFGASDPLRYNPVGVTSAQVLISTTPPAGSGCLCPSFRAHEPHIILFSQSRRADGSFQLLDSDYVQLYSEAANVHVKETCSQGPSAMPDFPLSSASSFNNEGASSVGSSVPEEEIDATTPWTMEENSSSSSQQ